MCNYNSGDGRLSVYGPTTVVRVLELHVFFCRFRPAPVVLVDGVLDREAFVAAFSSFCTSSIARFCRLCMSIVHCSGFETIISYLSSTGRPFLNPINLLGL